MCEVGFLAFLPGRFFQAGLIAAVMTVSPGADAASIRENRTLHSAVSLVNGKVLILGGGNKEARDQALDSLEVYDPATGTSMYAGRLERPQAGHTTTILKNGTLLLTGGMGRRDRFIRFFQVYDPAKGTSGPNGRMEERRGKHTATTLWDGTILVAGGDPDNPIAAELFDQNKHQLFKVGFTTVVRFAHTATLLKNGKVLITGGGSGQQPATDTAELYDPSTRRFTAISRMNSGRQEHTATLLKDGRVLIAGGNSQGKFVPSVELFDPSTGRFTLVRSNIYLKKSNHTATMLSDGRVLLAGMEADTHLFKPDNDTLTVGPRISPRYNHTATLLKDDSVLLIGGQVNENNILNSAEVVANQALPGPDKDHIPVITAQPASRTAKVGEKVTFSIRAAGEDLSYQWYKNSDAISGAMSQDYSIASAQMVDHGAVFCAKVMNSAGEVTSNDATLTVVDPDGAKPKIASFTANPATIQSGQESVLLAQFFGGDGVITPGYNPMDNGVGLRVKPFTTTTYTLTVTNAKGEMTQASVTVYVNAH